MSRVALHQGRVVDEDSSPYPPEWCIEDEESVPHSYPHDVRIEKIRDTLEGWRRRTGTNVLVGRELAFRWDEAYPRVGIDPDVYVAEEPPEGGFELYSMKLWATGHKPPHLCVEVVSKSRPDKDYTRAPERHDYLGTEELWVFDPDLFGRTKERPAVRLQLFTRAANGRLVRTYAGDGPMHSPYLNAWVFVTSEGSHLGIADDREGTQWWMTPEEMERAAKEQERAAKEQERAAKEQERAAKEQAIAAKEQAIAEKERAIAEKERERADKEKALARLAELEALLAARA